MTEKQLKGTLSGRVQGVMLRKRLQKVAMQLRLTGSVRNNPDSTVSFVATGEINNLEELVAWIQRYSFPARVTGMDLSWGDIPEDEKFKTFEVIKEDNFVVDQAKSFLNLGKTILKKNESELILPKHVVIIPDGNRRWAKKRGLKEKLGHKEGANLDRLYHLFQECKDLKIKYLSFWAFSTENWNRPKEEVDALFKLLKKNFKNLKELMIKEKVRFRHFGRTDRIPPEFLEQTKELEELSKDFTDLNFQFCFDYNGRDDIIRAVNKILETDIKEVDEKIFSEFLDTGKDVPDPDLIIRTAGEKRTSGIMAYQAAYAEYYFTNVYFPDFDTEQLNRALLDFSFRSRSFGGNKPK